MKSAAVIEKNVRHSVWLKTGKPPRFLPLRENVRADVCIIGGGIAGLTCAYFLACEQKSVVLLDAGDLGGGETGHTTAHISNAIDGGGYHHIESVHGAEGARLVAASHTAAIRRIENAVAEEGITCDFERLDGYLFDSSKRASASSFLLDKEYEAALRAGVPDLEKLKKVPLPFFETGPTIRFGSQAQFHPLKYLTGLSEKIRSLGERIFCRTRAVHVQGGRDAHVITEDGHRVSCDSIVVAANTPFNNRVVIHMKQAPYTTYAAAFRIPKGSVPRALYWDDSGSSDEAYHYIRVHAGRRDDLSDLLIVGGEDHKTGQANDAAKRYARLEIWARERFPMIRSMQFRWSGQVLESNDGLAYIGRNPNDAPNVFIATGDAGLGMTHSTIAGVMITDLVMGRKSPWEKIYDPARVTFGTFWDFARENSNVLGQYRDWFTAGQTGSMNHIPRGQGTIVRDGLHKHAVYRDDHGTLHACSAVCPHLGGIVAWNSEEKSWDCPCHGSRFDAFGKMIHGPAARDLQTLPNADKAAQNARAPGKSKGQGRKHF